MDIVQKKIREIVKTTSQASVTRKGEKAQKEFISSLENLSKKMQESSTDGICPLVSIAIDDTLTKLNVFLKDVNAKHDIDYEDYMDSLPEGDDD